MTAGLSFFLMSSCILLNTPTALFLNALLTNIVKYAADSYLTFSDTLINYITYPHPNASAWVVFVHGAGGSASIWYKQVRVFCRHYNVLLVDLRGHGDSSKTFTQTQRPYTFESVSTDVIDVLDHLNIKRAHFIGISLGTLIIQQIANIRPRMVQSMILGGAILKFNFKSQCLITLGNLCKKVIPYIWLYQLLAFIIMPKSNHQQSRLLFIQEARKMCQREFIRWFKLTKEVNWLGKGFQVKHNIKTFYIMGDQDYMFLPYVQKIAKANLETNHLVVIPQCGHVVNIERADIFNREALHFLNAQH